MQAKPGETQVWTIINKTKWSHPFHLHGFFFQVLDDEGKPVRPLAWKDTVDVPLEQRCGFGPLRRTRGDLDVSTATSSTTPTAG